MRQYARGLREVVLINLHRTFGEGDPSRIFNSDIAEELILNNLNILDGFAGFGSGVDQANPAASGGGIVGFVSALGCDLSAVLMISPGKWAIALSQSP